MIALPSLDRPKIKPLAPQPHTIHTEERRPKILACTIGKTFFHHG